MNGGARGRHEEARPPWDAGRAQQALANLALVAFDGAEVPALMGEAAEVACDVLGVELAAVMEEAADRGGLVLRAGRGVAEAEVGERTVPAGIDPSIGRLSMPAFAMLSTDPDPIRTADAREDRRFGPCPLMRDHGVVSGVMAKIYVHEKPVGVLGAHYPGRQEFTPEEASWLGDVAKVLGGALARARENGENGHRDRRVLRDAMEIIAASSGGRAALVATARVAVAEYADWCFVDVLEERDGVAGFTAGDKISRIAVGASDDAPNVGEIADELSYPLNPTAPHSTPKVLRTGKPDLIPAVTDAVLRESAKDSDHLGALRLLDPKSCLTVPMSISGRNVGALVLVSTDPARRYDDPDVEWAEDLARCAALVLAGRPATEPLSAARAAPPDTGLLRNLSRRQAEILCLLHEGLSREEIARRFRCTGETVRWHVKRAKAALGVPGCADPTLLATARRLGLFGDKA